MSPRASTGASSQESLLDEFRKNQNCALRLSVFTLSLPIGGAPGMSERLRRIHRAMELKKLSIEPLVVVWLSKLLWYFPGGFRTFLTRILLSKNTMYFSNLAGPQSPLSLAGVPITSMFNAVAPMEFGMSVSFFSYRGEARVSLCADTSVITDPRLMMDCLMQQLTQSTEPQSV